ncbi:type I restriction-modification system subunit M/S [Streptomyces sp. BE303]|uniref:type I restriction-modification system subunit M/S n=1 Tax=Streptomyces sp. BE303 TaxID=3002528 RepID=UPI002E76E54D|nr:N-6 DNA methylase [Streptomyces sp. BE303]MED7949330.1 N-6 DNA methylase [Streptomyces sp. BE303]
MAGQAAGFAVSSPGAEQQRSRSRRVLAELLKPQMVEMWGAPSLTAYLPLPMCLIFLRWGAHKDWAALEDRVDAHLAVTPKGFLSEVGERTDRLLKGCEVAPAMRFALQGLEPLPTAEVRQLMASVAGLDRDAFRDLLDAHADIERMDSRRAFTPRTVVALLSELVAPEGVSGRIHDPYPRGGELLSAMVAASGDGSVTAVTAGKPDGATLRLTAMNLMLHGVTPRVGTHDIAPWPEPAERRQEPVDLVLTNPPFNAESGRVAAGGWRYGPPPPSNANFAWIQHILSTLGPGGRAAVIMADNAAVSDQPRERAIRQALVEDGVVDGILALPPHLFTGTAVSACIWFLSAPSQRTEVHFINARELGELVTRTRRELSTDDVRLLGQIHRSLRAGNPMPDEARALGRSVSVEEIEQRGYSLSPVDYVSLGAYVAATPAQVESVRRKLDDALDLAGSLDEEARRCWERAAPGRSPGPSAGGRRNVLLQDLCKVQPGPSPSLLNPGMYSEDGPVRVVLPKHLRNRRIHGSEDTRISARDARQLERFLLSEGDILCTRTGTVGPVALVGAEGAGSLYNGNLLRLHGFEPGVDPRFVLAYLSLPGTQAWIKDRAAMSTVDSIKTSAMRQLPVSLPPYEEQHRIGELLRVFDDQVAAHQQVATAADAARGELSTLLMDIAAMPAAHQPDAGLVPYIAHTTEEEAEDE